MPKQQEEKETRKKETNKELLHLILEQDKKGRG